MPAVKTDRVTTPSDRERDTLHGGVIDLSSTETRLLLAGRAASAAERARKARLARWQLATGNERDERERTRQTDATRAQDARSAPGSHNSSPA